MKKYLLFFLLVMMGNVWGQVTLPHYDGINYTIDQGLQTQSGWTSLNSGDALLIASGSLTYPGLLAEKGNKVTFDGAGIDAAKLFTQQTLGSTYYSFLLNVSSLGSLNTTGGYFTGFTEGTSTTFGATIWLKPSSGKYKIGINPRTTAANTVWSLDLELNTVYFIVVSYEFKSGGTNDVVNLWVNPSLSDFGAASAPTATISATNGLTDLANVNRILIRQDGSTATPFIEMDELRIGTTWASVTPAAKYYSKSTGYLNDVSNWGSVSSDGSGTSPNNFTANYQTFNIVNNTVPSINANWEVSGTNSKAIVGDGTNSCTFTIPADYSYSGTIDVQNNSTLKIMNTSMPTFGQLTSGSTIEFAGITSQNMTGFPSTYIGTLKINNSNDVNLGSSLTSNGNIIFNNGSLLLSDYDLTLGASTTITGSLNATNKIVTNGTGVVKKIFTSDGQFTFPIGDNTVTAEYSPVTIDIAATSYAADAYVSAKVVNQKHPNNTSITNFINRYWSLTSSGITDFLYDIEMQYTDADLNSGTDENSLYLGKYSGGSWTLLNKATAPSNTLSGTTLDSFSDFTGGESAALPVELTSFTAKYLSSGVVLNWQTATEINNNKFEVERQINEGNWEVVGEVLGHGNSNTVIDYTYTDSKTSTKGKYNYRLKQIDNDGTFKYTQVVNVTVGNIDNYELAQNYPNPFNPSTNINFTMPKAGNVKIVLFNALGQEVATLFNGNKDAGFHTVQFNANGLPSGIYFYQMTSEGFNQVRKMILAK